MGTTCASFLADLLLHADEAGFLQVLLKNKERKLPQTFNSSFRYISDVMSLNNSRGAVAVVIVVGFITTYAISACHH